MSTVALAGDWPRFRGPNGSGVAETRNLPARFGPGQNVIWKTALPPGHSSPVVTGERVFLTAFEGDKLLTYCLSRANGRVLWRSDASRARAERLDKRNNPASPTPVTDGRNVYVFFPDFGLLSYDGSGVERWRVPLGPFNNLYGMGASPILADGNVVLVCDQTSGSYIAAFGAADGKLLWKTARPEALSGHSTPILYRPREGEPAQILAPGSFRMDAYSAQTGESVWWVNGLASEMKSVPSMDADTVYVSGFNTPENDPGRQIAIPAFDDLLARNDADRNGRISKQEAPDQRTRSYFSFLDLDHDGFLDVGEWKLYQAVMGAENGLRAIRLGGRGDTTTASLRWKYQRSVPQLPSTLLYRGVLYMLNDSGILTTLNPKNGIVLKRERLRAAGPYYASPVAADGKVVFVSASGAVTVLHAGGQQEPFAASELDDECYATPAIADGRIYIRTRSALYCFGK
ncbi:MAG: PQQ-binding-like beta-propeller repeat protein [Bryobacteraceae bacterium]